MHRDYQEGTDMTHPESQMLNDKGLRAAIDAARNAEENCDPTISAAIRAYLSALHRQEAAAPSVTTDTFLRDNPLKDDAPRYDGTSLGDLADEIGSKIESLLSEERKGAFIGSHQARAIKEIQDQIRASPAPVAAAPVGESVEAFADDIAEAVMPFMDEMCGRGDVRAAIARILSSIIPAAKPAGVEALTAENEQLRAERDALFKRINSPETEDWMAGVPLEAAHQIERHGAEHDAGKTAWDWFWLIGYLSQKAAASQTAGDLFKAKHHTISTAAALLNWHRHLTGENTAMRPGIDPVARGIEPAALSAGIATPKPEGAKARCCSATSPCSWQRHNGMDSVCPLCQAAATAPAGDVDGVREELHSCVCLLEVMADNAKERGDDVEWAMMSVMAKNGRNALAPAGDGVAGMVLVSDVIEKLEFNVKHLIAEDDKADALFTLDIARDVMAECAKDLASLSGGGQYRALSASTAGGGK